MKDDAELPKVPASFPRWPLDSQLAQIADHFGLPKDMVGPTAAYEREMKRAELDKLTRVLSDEELAKGYYVCAQCGLLRNAHEFGMTVDGYRPNGVRPIHNCADGKEFQS